MKIVAFVAALFAVAPLSAQTPVADPAPSAGPRPDSLSLARQYVQWLYTGKADSLYAHTGEALKKRLQNPDQFHEFTSQIVGNAGAETEVESEKFVTRNGKTEYWRVARFSLLSEDLLFRLVLVDGEIAGIGFNQAWDTPPVDKPKG